MSGLKGGALQISATHKLSEYETLSIIGKLQVYYCIPMKVIISFN